MSFEFPQGFSSITPAHTYTRPGMLNKNTRHICLDTRANAKTNAAWMLYKGNALPKMTEAETKRSHRLFHSLADGCINFLPHYLCHKMFLAEYQYLPPPKSTLLPFKKVLFESWMPGTDSCTTECGEAYRAQ